MQEGTRGQLACRNVNILLDRKWSRTGWFNSIGDVSRSVYFEGKLLVHKSTCIRIALESKHAHV